MDSLLDYNKSSDSQGMESDWAEQVSKATKSILDNKSEFSWNIFYKEIFHSLLILVIFQWQEIFSSFYPGNTGRSNFNRNIHKKLEGEWSKQRDKTGELSDDRTE